MTEQEWQKGEDATPMTAFLRRRGVSDRKARLFYTACYRVAWEEDPPLPALWEVIEVAERWVDGFASETERAWAENRARSLLTGMHGWLSSWQEAANVSAAARAQLGDLVTLEELEEAEQRERYCERVSARVAAALVSTELEHDVGSLDLANRVETPCDGVSILRDIFGNPFRPVAFDPEWRTSTAVALAKQMCESRDFSTMPILADALQDAGCDNADIFNHCRDPHGVHVRGSWVVDLVLGKT
ncbi:MAG: hypothetical protein U0792_00125 [Gemmataceae bacterium]